MAAARTVRAGYSLFGRQGAVEALRVASHPVPDCVAARQHFKSEGRRALPLQLREVSVEFATAYVEVRRLTKQGHGPGMRVRADQVEF